MSGDDDGVLLFLAAGTALLALAAAAAGIAVLVAAAVAGTALLVVAAAATGTALLAAAGAAAGGTAAALLAARTVMLGADTLRIAAAAGHSPPQIPRHQSYTSSSDVTLLSSCRCCS